MQMGARAYGKNLNLFLPSSIVRLGYSTILPQSFNSLPKRQRIPRCNLYLFNQYLNHIPPILIFFIMDVLPDDRNTGNILFQGKRKRY